MVALATLPLKRDLTVLLHDDFQLRSISLIHQGLLFIPMLFQSSRLLVVSHRFDIASAHDVLALASILRLFGGLSSLLILIEALPEHVCEPIVSSESVSVELGVNMRVQSVANWVARLALLNLFFQLLLPLVFPLSRLLVKFKGILPLLLLSDVWQTVKVGPHLIMAVLLLLFNLSD